MIYFTIFLQAHLNFSRVSFLLLLSFAFHFVVKVFFFFSEWGHLSVFLSLPPVYLGPASFSVEALGLYMTPQLVFQQLGLVEPS